MLIYWGIFLVLAAGGVAYRYQDIARSHRLLILLGALPLALMIGLRWEIGPDWQQYLAIYRYSQLFSFEQALGRPDPGYFTLMWLLHQAAAPFWAMNMVCGLIFVGGLTAFAIRQVNPWLALLVAFPYLVIVVAMSANRQTVALGLMFFALNAFERRRLVSFVVIGLVAGLFHASAMLMLPLCLLAYAENRLQQIALVIFTVIIATQVSGDAFETYARRYYTSQVQSGGTGYRLAMNGLAAILFLSLRHRFPLPRHQFRLWRNFSIYALALVPLFFVFPSSTAIDRFLLYLFPLQLAVWGRVPTLLSEEGQSAEQYGVLVAAYSALVLTVFLNFGTFAEQYVPYKAVQLF